MRLLHFVAFLTAIGTLAAVSTPAPMLAEDFRVDNAVYEGDQKDPISQSVTIFHGGVVYDCMTAPAETVVFDEVADRFVLLNPARRIRAELTTSELAALVDRLQKLALKNDDAVVRFLAAPKFHERTDETSGDLILSSPLVTYRVTLAPQSNASIVTQYHEFCDYYARLNSLLSSGSRPPFGRLVVNAAMAQRNATASQVVLTIASENDPKPQTVVRSEHRVVDPLTQDDLERISQIREQMEGFQSVGFNQYRKLWAR